MAYKSAFYSFFLQDDFQVTPGFKLLYGIRYDLFDVPSARPFAANPFSQEFALDTNNFAPRVGFSWTLDSSARTVLRASTGVMYEPPLLNFYEDAILRNGDPRASPSRSPRPGGIARLPDVAGQPVRPASCCPRRASWRWTADFDAVRDPDQRPDRARDRPGLLRLAGFVSPGRNMPLLVDVNMIPTGQTLADGRPSTRPRSTLRRA